MLAFDAYGRDLDMRVALLHGWPLDRSIWSAVATSIASSGLRVLVPDLPGSGESPTVAPGRETVEDAADEVAEFLRSFGPAPLPVAGHSFGGYVALALAERHPILVSGVGLVSSRTLADTESARAGRQKTIESVRGQGAKALLPDLPRKLLAPDAAAPLQERAAALVSRARPDGIVAGLRAMAARPDRSAVLEGFRRPVLVLHGDADQLIPVREAADPRGPRAVTRVILPGVGHMPMWEAPQATAEAILRWIRSSPRNA